uniref:Uncharacterized protein n=1 Tax=Arundo donax TaxID=35708 RepID=A0A0A8XZD0_ARUDO
MSCKKQTWSTGKQSILFRVDPDTKQNIKANSRTSYIAQYTMWLD